VGELERLLQLHQGPPEAIVSLAQSQPTGVVVVVVSTVRLVIMGPPEGLVVVAQVQSVAVHLEVQRPKVVPEDKETFSLGIPLGEGEDIVLLVLLPPLRKVEPEELVRLTLFQAQRLHGLAGEAVVQEVLVAEELVVRVVVEVPRTLRLMVIQEQLTLVVVVGVVMEVLTMEGWVVQELSS